MTQKFKRMLLATDFSEGSQAALDAAHALAQACGATIDAVHVWQASTYIPPEASVGLPGDEPQTLAEMTSSHAHNALRDFVESARARGTHIEHAFLEQGSPPHVIVELAKRERHDLILTGTAGRTGLAHMLLGSVAEKVVRHSSLPVLTVPLANAEANQD